ncbi:MAG: TIGR02996 domain-containing protein, partial [Planctomycetales bacterium]
MDSQSAFLREIIDAPEDDAPRLIYADWLEERGDPKAGFIRAQCQLAHMNPDDPGRSVLLHREQGYLFVYGDEWLGELPSLPGVEWGITVDGVSRAFQRGFVEDVAASDPKSFFQAAEILFDATCIRRLRIRGMTPAACELLSRVEVLSRLKWLELTAGFIGPNGA